MRPDPTDTPSPRSPERLDGTSSGQRVRKILHVDMDAFFASVEQRDRPELRGRPVVVGGQPGSRGVVAAASYEARRFGVRSAMPSAHAARLCPEAVFVPPDHAKYREVSRELRGIFHQVTELVEPLSLDEAYLDVTDNALGEPLAGKVALWLKRAIRGQTGLTASAGVGPSKFIAKVASDLDKPDGLVIVPPSEVEAFVAKLPVGRLWGVGPATEKRLRGLGLRTARDLRDMDRDLLVRTLGKQGAFLHRLAHGVDERQVTPHREAKSRSAETTFTEDIHDRDTLLATVERLSQRVASSLCRLHRVGRTVTLKVRYEDFTTVTRSATLPVPTQDSETVARTASDLLVDHTEAGDRPVRLVGVGVSALEPQDAPRQLPLPL